MQRHRRMWPVSVQCRVLELSVAGHHEHLVRRASDAQRRPLSDNALLVHIKAIHTKTHGGYGWPRTWKELPASGVRVGKQRVQKLMQLHGIRAKGKRRFKVTTDEGRLFLAVVIDLFGRQVIGRSLRQDMTHEIVIDALRMAWFKSHPSKQAGVIFHSDRGRRPGDNPSSQHIQNGGVDEAEDVEIESIVSTHTAVAR